MPGARASQRPYTAVLCGGPEVRPLSSDDPAPLAPQLAPVAQDTRDRVIAALTAHFTAGALDVDEYDHRLSQAHNRTSSAEIEALLGDLPGGRAALAAAAPARRELVPGQAVRPRDALTAILGGARRTGAWEVPRTLRVTTILGGAELDFRDARLPAGPVEVHVRAMMGGVQIIVPPGLPVEVGGTAILGGFDEVDHAPSHPEPQVPLLRIRGLVVMGGVQVDVRLPGESEREARKRRKRAARTRKQREG